jgi:two-component sensor histidine kinase
MSLISRISRLGNLGVKPRYKPWEKYLARKLNIYTLISIVTVALAIISYICIGDFNFITDLTVLLLAFPFVIFFNIRFNYVYALYLFYFISSGIILLFSFRMGEDSEIYLFFFPLIISLLLLLNRKEMYIHIRVLLGVILLLIVINLIGIKVGWFHGNLSLGEMHRVRMYNIFFSSFITLSFAIALSKQNAMQENELLTLVKEKETLLAEVHHRIKNNMAIISSILNLKKESCNSNEAREVLEDCKNRIYSMALIHKNIYGNKSLENINFQEYITELGSELISAYSEKNKIDLSINATDCNLFIDTAIPCGFIINELLTNSLKYALVENEVLILKIIMEKKGRDIQLIYSDNGPGFSFDSAKSENSLGMTLIDLLSHQLQAKYSFNKEVGLVFDMKFTLPKSEIAN